MPQIGTLGYLIKGDEILLGQKKYGRSKGILNGFGGKYEKTDESIDAALIREFKEETSLDIKNPELKGEICFKIEGELKVIYVYLIEHFEGTPKESEEMTVSWHNINSIDLTKMWPNDQIWFNMIFLPFKFVMLWGGDSIDDYSTKMEINLLKELHQNSYENFMGVCSWL